MSRPVVWSLQEMEEVCADLRKDVGQLMADRAALGAEKAKTDEATVPPLGMIFGTRDLRTGEPDKQRICVAPPSMFDPDSRDGYSMVLRIMAEKSAADAVVFGSEVWSIDPAVADAMTHEQYVKEIRTWSGRLQEHPRRVELVTLTMEHVTVDGMMIWRAPIRRDGQGVPSLGDWTQGRLTAPMGRMARILPDRWMS
jgi:hypothetical protein